MCHHPICLPAPYPQQVCYYKACTDTAALVLVLLVCCTHLRLPHNPYLSSVCMVKDIQCFAAKSRFVLCQSVTAVAPLLVPLLCSTYLDIFSSITLPSASLLCSTYLDSVSTYHIISLLESLVFSSLRTAPCTCRWYVAIVSYTGQQRHL